MALLLAFVGTAFGAVLGYMLRFREWLREKRLTAYTDFGSAFAQVTRDGLELGGRLDREEELAAFIESWERFSSRRAQVLLLATEKTASAAQACVAFITGDLWPIGALTKAELDRAQWQGLGLEQAFIRAAADELGPRLVHRSKASEQTRT